MADENVERPGAVPEAARADKPPRKVQRQPPTIKPKPKEEKAKGSRLERAKAWSDSVLSVVKTVTLLAVTGMIVWLATNVIWHDRGQRRVSFEIDPKVEKLIFDLGVDFDLRAGVRDETNSRIRGVKSFLEAGLFKNIDLGGSQSISFKPFGVDLTATDLAGIARLLLGGGEPAFRVRFELLCDPGPCDSAQPANQPAAERFKQLTLIVNVGGPERHERLTFPLPVKPAALRRGLRAATQRTSEKLLESAEPVIASVLYNNAVFGTNFPDEQKRYPPLAAGAAFQAKIETPDRACLSEIVLGDSLMQRGAFDEGIQTLRRVAGEAGRKLSSLATTPPARARARTCLIQATTDQVFFLPWRLCADWRGSKTDGSRRHLLRQTVDEIEDLKKAAGSATDAERSRIEEYLAYSRFLENLFANDGSGMASAICGLADSKAPRSNASNPHKNAGEALTLFRESLPPTRSRQIPVQVLGVFIEYINRTGPADALVRLDALTVARVTLDAYLEKIADPRLLYLLRGRIHREIATTVRDVLRSASDAEKQGFVKRWTGEADDVKGDVNALLHGFLVGTLTHARIAFENASAAVNPFPWFGPSSNIEALISTGDMYYAAEYDGFLDDTEKSYANAIRMFIEQDAPLREFKMMAKAAARWAIIRNRAGACRTGAARDIRWDGIWILLGAAPDHDWCSIMRADQPLPTEKLGVFGVVSTYVQNVGKECGQLGNVNAGADKRYGRLDLVECLEQADVKVSNEFFLKNNGPDIDRKISLALGAK